MPNMKQMYEDTNKTIEAYPRVWLPVGTIYYNKNDISDEIEQYFVGTWERCLQGEVLVGVNENDNDFKTSWGTFGSKTHTLTTAQLPNINGRVTIHGAEGGSNMYVGSGVFAASNINSNNYKLAGSAATGAQSLTNIIIDVGNNQPHNNIQPSRMAYAWIRVS